MKDWGILDACIFHNLMLLHNLILLNTKYKVFYTKLIHINNLNLHINIWIMKNLCIYNKVNLFSNDLSK